MPNASDPRPRTKPPEERRDELMNAAQKLFLKHGVAATTIEQITSAADVAKGTFYLYFKSKEDICAALGDRFAAQLLASIQAAVARKEPNDWRGRLGRWTAAAASGYLDAIQLHDILFYAQPPTRAGLVDNILIDDLAALLKAGARDRAWTVDDARFAAVFLFSGLHAAVDDAFLSEKHVKRGRLARRLERLCHRAVSIA